jgi:hypothetical protein
MTYLELYLEKIKLLTGNKEDYLSVARVLFSPRALNSNTLQKFTSYILKPLCGPSDEEKLKELEELLQNFDGDMKPLELFLRGGQVVPEPLILEESLVRKIVALKGVEADLQKFNVILMQGDLQEELLEALIALSEIKLQPSYPLKLHSLLNFSIKRHQAIPDDWEEKIQVSSLAPFAICFFPREEFFRTSHYNQALLPHEVFNDLYKKIEPADLCVTSSNFVNHIIFINRIAPTLSWQDKNNLLTYLYINNRKTFFYLFDDFYERYPEPFCPPKLYQDQKQLEQALNQLFQVIGTEVSWEALEEIITKLKLQNSFIFPWQVGTLIHPIFYLERRKAEDWVKTDPKLLLALRGRNFLLSDLLLEENLGENSSAQLLIKLYHDHKLWTNLPEKHSYIETPFALIIQKKEKLLEGWIKADAEADSLILTRKLQDPSGDFISFYFCLMQVMPDAKFWSLLSPNQREKAPVNLPDQLYDLIYEGNNLSQFAASYLYNIVIFHENKPLPVKLFSKILDDYLVLLTLKQKEAEFFKESLLYLLEIAELVSLEELDLKKLLHMKQFHLLKAIIQSFFRFYAKAIDNKKSDLSSILNKLLPVALEAFCLGNYAVNNKEMLDFAVFLHDFYNKNLTEGQLLSYERFSNSLTYYSIQYYVIFTPPDCRISPLSQAVDRQFYEQCFENQPRNVAIHDLIIHYYNRTLLTMSALVQGKFDEIPQTKTTMKLLLLNRGKSFNKDHPQDKLLCDLLKLEEEEVKNPTSALWQSLKFLPFDFLQPLLEALNLHKSQPIINRIVLAAIEMNDQISVKSWLKKNHDDIKLAMNSLESAVINLNEELVEIILNIYPELFKQPKKKLFFYNDAFKLPEENQNLFLLLKAFASQEENRHKVTNIAEKLLEVGYPRPLIQEASNKTIKDFMQDVFYDKIKQIVRNKLLNACNLNPTIFNLFDIINLCKKTGSVLLAKPIFITISSKFNKPELQQLTLFKYYDVPDMPQVLDEVPMQELPLIKQLMKEILDNNIKGKVQAVIVATASLSSSSAHLSLIGGIFQLVPQVLEMASVGVNVAPLVFSALMISELMSSIKSNSSQKTMTYSDIQALSCYQEQQTWVAYFEKPKNSQYVSIMESLYPELTGEILLFIVEKFHLNDPNLLIQNLLESDNIRQKLEILKELVQIINLAILEVYHHKASDVIKENPDKKNLIFARLSGKIQFITASDGMNLLPELKQIIQPLDYDLSKESLYLYILGGEIPLQLQNMIEKDQVIDFIVKINSIKTERKEAIRGI